MQEKFDFIIVGAGSAGCVLANRLSANPDVSVLVLEAGGPKRNLLQKTPAAFYKQFKTAVDWDYTTEPQAHLNGRSLYWPRGKTIGGSSAINAMIYIRGNRRDYDQWAELGNETWSYDDVLPYFRKMEKQALGSSRFHGVEGELHVVNRPYTNPVTSLFLEAAVSCGYPLNPDFNGAEQDGFGVYQVTQKKGERQSAADAFLRPVLKRKNLTAVTHAHVTKIIMDGKTAVGVEYIHQNQTHKASATQEVILSGGSINSPQLLLLSGIGPAAHLQKMNIPIVFDLPGVGRNLQDHLIVPFVTYCTEPITLDKANNLKNVAKFLLAKRGPLTSNVAEAGGFIKTKPSLNMPDIQYHFGPALFIEHGLVELEGHGFSIGPTLLHPKSRGKIELRSTDPLAPPMIQPNYLSADEDVRSLLAGLKIAREIANQPVFDAIRGEEFMPGKEVVADSELITFIRQRAETLYHPVGTCKMGVDETAVVDEQLRVYGIKNLRVVDASIMPTVVGGNTNAPVMMIAEKVAEQILA